MKKISGLLLLAVLLVVITTGTTSLAAATNSATTVSLLKLVSGPSPFASCTIGNGPGAVNYVNAEVEPFVAVNPTNPANIIGVWQQDRWSDGGSHGLVAGYSTNGGSTWNETPQPFSACAPGGLNYERASDPWVSFGPDGTAYSVSISFNESNNNNAVGAATSSDGGKTWSNLTVLKADTGTTQFFNDKESVTADPVKAGVAYAVWDRLASPNANPYADAHALAYTGPTWFSKTTDGGKSWSTAKIIFATGQNNQTIANQIVVDPTTGTLYDFFDWIVSTGPNGQLKLHGLNVAFMKSTDGGNTWTAPQLISKLQTVGVTDPNTGATIRTGDIIPEPAIDSSTGQLYVVWQDSRFNGGKYDEVVLSTSKDGGATWSAPVRVNTPTGRPAFTPSVQVNAKGVVAVTYYDFRNLQAGNTTTLPTDYWFTTSFDGGKTFSNETHLAGSFDMLTAPYAGGYFTGDYEGLGSFGSTFIPFFVQANSGNTANRTDVFTDNVTP